MPSLDDVVSALHHRVYHEPNRFSDRLDALLERPDVEGWGIRIPAFLDACLPTTFGALAVTHCLSCTTGVPVSAACALAACAVPTYAGVLNSCESVRCHNLGPCRAARPPNLPPVPMLPFEQDEEMELLCRDLVQ